MRLLSLGLLTLLRAVYVEVYRASAIGRVQRAILQFAFLALRRLALSQMVFEVKAIGKLYCLSVLA